MVTEEREEEIPCLEVQSTRQVAIRLPELAKTTFDREKSPSRLSQKRLLLKKDVIVAYPLP